jgi:hypothetical protein
MTGNQVSLNSPEYTIKHLAIQGKKNAAHAKREKTGVNKLTTCGMMTP